MFNLTRTLYSSIQVGYELNPMLCTITVLLQPQSTMISPITPVHQKRIYNLLLSLIVYTSRICQANLQNLNDPLDPFPTQVLSAYSDRSLSGGKWERINDKQEPQQLVSTTTQSELLVKWDLSVVY